MANRPIDLWSPFFFISQLSPALEARAPDVQPNATVAGMFLISTLTVNFLCRGICPTRVQSWFMTKIAFQGERTKSCINSVVAIAYPHYFISHSKVHWGWIPDRYKKLKWSTFYYIHLFHRGGWKWAGMAWAGPDVGHMDCAAGGNWHGNWRGKACSNPRNLKTWDLKE